MNFEFATARRILFGAGSVNNLGPNIRNFGRRALVVTGNTPQRANRLVASLAASDIVSTIYPVAGEPGISTIENGVVVAKREQSEFVIAFGGGSVIDAGKAIAAMLTNEGEVLDYLEIIGRGQVLKKWPAPFVAIPTTAGTGAEVTRNAVLASPEHKVKVSLRSPLMLPRLAVVDPELTQDLPPALTATTGLDALTQLIEPYVCLRANPMTDGFCLEGIRRAARSLSNAVFNGQSPAAREDMALASLFGGLALANAGLGAVHGFAAAIGGSFPAPHGAVCAALLPHVMAANITALRTREPRSYALGRYYRIAALLTGNPHATADAGVEWVRQLVADLPIPKLGAYGIREEHVADLVAKAASASSMKANPILLTPEELSQTLRRAL
ncbi:MAG TPA: iron-containing alcohol dehydrogenase [Candidatus Acidoferrales bacterium]|nr:iron-containing alcohol dehydrogenase [Candidatus Acidoferrales bacterium]